MIILRFILLSVSVFCCVACSTQQNIGNVASASANASQWQSDERKIGYAVAQKRQYLGKPTMKYHEGIAGVARKHADRLVKTYEKTGIKDPNHKKMKSRVGQLSLKFSMARVAENVAFLDKGASNQASKMVSMWMNSSTHKATLIGNWNFTGVGVSKAQDGTVFAVQLFGLKTDFTF